MSLCAIEDLPLLLLHHIAVLQEIPFVSRPCLCSSSFLAGDLQWRSFESTHNFYDILCLQFWSRCSGMKSGDRCQYILKLSKLIQSILMAESSFDFTEGSFLQLNGQKHLRSVAEDLISNKRKRTKRIYQKRWRHGHYKTLTPIFLNRS